MYVDPNVIDSSVHATITEARAYYHKEYKHWYLTVTYSYKDKDGFSKELEIPAIPLPLPQNHLPIVRDANCDVMCPFGSYHEYMPSIFCESEVKLDMGNIHDQDGAPLRRPKAFFAIKQIPKSMTKTDIEKALGYPINIVEEEKK